MTFILGIFTNPFGYDFITNVFGALFLFLFFTKLPPRSRRPVNWLSARAFDVFFMHGQKIFQMLGIGAVPQNILLIPHLAFVLVCCYLLGTATGSFRMFLFDHSVNKALSGLRWLNRNISV